MQYVFNPKNRQINPVTAQTFIDPTLRDKAVSPELYALVCKGKISVEDVAALFAVNKSPEILVKNHLAVKESPIAKAPANTKTVGEGEGEKPLVAPDGKAEDDKADANGAFDGRSLSCKTNAELLILAGTIGVDVNAEGFAPTRGNLIKAIMAKADAAEAKAGESAKTDAPPAA